MLATTHKVEYHEVDPMGVVNNAYYIVWMETARINALDSAGLSYKVMEEQGFFGATLSVSCDYKRSARFGQTVEIEPTLAELDERFFTINYTIRDADSKKERAIATSKHCFIGFDGKMISLAEQNPTLYEQIKALLGK